MNMYQNFISILDCLFVQFYDFKRVKDCRASTIITLPVLDLYQKLPLLPDVARCQSSPRHCRDIDAGLLRR